MKKLYFPTICPVCKRIFNPKTIPLKQGGCTRTCSIRCAAVLRLGIKQSPETIQKRANKLIGKPSGMLGKKHSEATKIKMSGVRTGKHWTLSEATKKKYSIIQTGIQRPAAIKTNAGYRALHGWVARRKGLPTKCEYCKKDGLVGHQIHWANTDHKYKRNSEDWIRLCPSCHKKYDKKNNL